MKMASRVLLRLQQCMSVQTDPCAAVAVRCRRIKEGAPEDKSRNACWGSVKFARSRHKVYPNITQVPVLYLYRVQESTGNI